MQYNKQSIVSSARSVFGIAITALVLTLAGISQAKAQTGGTSGATETRARRAPAVKDTTKSSDGDAASNPLPVRAEKDGDARTSTDQVKPDRIALLRSQILEAKSEIERVRLQRTLVDYLIALGRHGEAATEMRAMLSAENLDAASYYNIGNGLARLGEAEDAVTAYRKAIEARQGNYPRALNNLGVVLLELRRADEAYDVFVLAIKQQNFRYAEASYNLGKLYATRDEADLAISEWTRALTVQPDHVDAAIALGRAYALTGKPGRGLEVIDMTLKRTGKNERLEAVREEIASTAPGK